ncbi:MAG: DUF262 domain-containing protein [Opitutales bacterium]|nr:DUF262 domain-containing protein [Opitutales bacterium]
MNDNSYICNQGRECNSDIDLKPVKKILDQSFFIPGYQRGYRWTKQQVQDLLRDITEFMSKRPSNAEIYCLQPLVVKERVGKWEVIDGQQRLTTIKILLAYLDKKMQSGLSTGLSIEYETRTEEASELRIGAKEFLNAISEEFVWTSDGKKTTAELAEKNIDFYHMQEAYNTINAWFATNANDESFCKTFKEVLCEKVHFIWYQTDDDPIKTFTRLNIGKIPLTDSELVKALFLNESNFKQLGSENEILLHQREIAMEWDAIEATLQDDEFWLFFHDYEPDYNKFHPTRFDFILELAFKMDELKLKQYILEEKNNSGQWDEQNWREFFGDDEHKVFRYFYEFFNLNKTNIANAIICPSNNLVTGFDFRLRDGLWKRLKKYFQILEEWYRDMTYYHYIGYLRAQKSKNTKWDIDSLFVEWNNGSRECFKTYILRQIEETISKCKDLNKEYGTSGNPKTQCYPLLLLFNVQTVIDQNDKLVKDIKYGLGAFYRFPFHLLKKEAKKVSGKGWEIEHIASNAGDDLDNDENKNAFLWTAAACADGELKKRIEAYFNKSDDSLSFDELRKQFDELRKQIEEQLYSFPEDKKNTIGNFTLLDSATNEEYQNDPFPIKRVCVLTKEQGHKAKKQPPNGGCVVRFDKTEEAIAFVPPCTKAVFIKAYTDMPEAWHTWTENDAVAYQKAIFKTLERFGVENPDTQSVHQANEQVKKEVRS